MFLREPFDMHLNAETIFDNLNKNMIDIDCKQNINLIKQIFAARAVIDTIQLLMKIKSDQALKKAGTQEAKVS